MTSQTLPNTTTPDTKGWLKTYYGLRAGVSILWVAAAFTVGRTQPAVAAGLLVAYPAWDALANALDASRSGGFGRNLTQVVNLVISGLTAAAVAFALTKDMHTVVAVFGVWAGLAGLLQLLTGIRRWKTGAQWAMVLSGAQSALAGAFFIIKARGPAPGITDIAPYAAFGAFYFLVSAIWLSVKGARSTSAR